MYIVIGDLDFSVDYGVDRSFYILGIFNSLDEANEFVEKNKSREDDFIADGHKCYPFECEQEDPAKYNELSYCVKEFTGEPLYCGGAGYCE